MKVGIMQPYFFPYLGYFSLIKQTDLFILLDEVQFIRHGWIERNRIIKQDSDWIYIKVPLIKSEGQKTLIKDLKIDNSQPWKQKILAQLQVYKKIAAFYNEVERLINDLLANDFDDLVSLNKLALQSVCVHLGILKEIKILSEMDLVFEKPLVPDEWALNICKAVHADEYWNPPGGIEFFNREKFDQASISLKFQRLHLTPYPQKRNEFTDSLSIIDALMFNSIETIHSMLDNYEIL
jgi:hypothetical protein